MKMNKPLNNKKYKALLITAIIALLSNCNQAQTTPTAIVAANINNADPNKQTKNDDSYFTKKGYQNRFTRWFKPYKINIQQGNIISKEMVDNIKLGMSKDQVKHVLGTSVLTDSFDNDQWIYAFSDAANGKVKKEQVMVLSFKNDHLDDVKENSIIQDQV